MAATGLNSAQCRDNAIFASTFWHHFDAAMVTFIVSTPVMAVLVLLLLTICRIPQDKSTRRSRLPERPMMISARFLSSTVLLSLMACLFTFQVLFVLFTENCLGGTIHTSDTVFVAMVAGVGALFLTFAVSTWLYKAAEPIRMSLSWCWKVKRRVSKSFRESASGDIRNANQSHEVQRRDEQVIGHENNKPAAPTLLPYMV
jgi:hypothetical protein